MADSAVPDLRQLSAQFPRPGRLDAIFLRPGRHQPVTQVAHTEAWVDRGLQGDRTAQRTPSRPGGGKRQVTLIQAEHLPVVAQFLGRPSLDAALLRRNLLVSGLNLLATKNLFKDRRLLLRVGETVLLEVTGPCDPCSQMEAILGPGGFNALRGHGGITARVLVGGRLQVNDTLRLQLD